MASLRERIKATLLRRDSRQKSPAPSKTSSKRDCTSSASTQTQPGDVNSEEHGRLRSRGSHRSLIPERTTSRGRLPRLLSYTSRKDSKNNTTTNLSHSAAPGGNADADADADADTEGGGNANGGGHDGNEEVVDDGPPQGECGQAVVEEDRGVQPVDGSTVPAAPAPAPAAQAAGPDANNVDANVAPPPLLPAEPHPPSPLQRASQAPDSSTTTAASAAEPCMGAGAQGLAALSTPSADVVIPSSINTTTTTSTTSTTTVAAVATTAAALPSIHEQPATPPTVPTAAAPAHLESEVASPIPRAAVVFNTNINPNAERDRDRDRDRDRQHSTIPPELIHSNPALLTPPATSQELSKPPLPSTPALLARPSAPLRSQSILPANQHKFVRALLNGPVLDSDLDAAASIYQRDPLLGMVSRKIWVKRPLASATLITITEDDLVDDVRDQVLRKYGNSLGRQYDAPDLTIRICNREQQSSRTLQPDEPISRVIDSYYANGQSVDDALLIDIPSRRTPKASPNPRFYADDRPHESGTDYFPPFHPSFTHHTVSTTHVNGSHAPHFPPSMSSIVAGSQLPQVPSPGGSRRLALNRPNLQGMHTASPVSTVPNSHPPQAGPTSTGTHKYPRPVRSRTHSGASSEQSNQQPAAPAIPTPPPVERTATPPLRTSSPRPSVRTKKKRTVEPAPALTSNLQLDIAVPPINILIVEDNVINLRLLEAFVKRLKVRWQTAVNGKEAVDKWRAGGFHLVLMDIQLPIMNGLDATREIRRIEKVNSIGVFSSSASSPPEELAPEVAEEDRLANTEMFKSPVIIVALTASSLQSDREGALAAGCNDFLTKPVNFDWLQRKVKEWGCMQALIDFDGWRKWKDFSQKTQAEDAAKKALAAKAKPAKKNRAPLAAAA
ncbi:hypothetical protein F4808DRAFT_469160 [Astrocystis sublimbata]|nr:hypothetical protein F4808DRAFT_469160 [Astrocystis sublimbata]